MTTETTGLPLLFELLANGRATCSVEDAGRIMGFGRDKSYTMADAGDIPTIGAKRQRVVPLPLLGRKLGVPVNYIITANLGSDDAPTQRTSFTCDGCGQTYLIPVGSTGMDIMFDHFEQHDENAA